MIFRKLIINLSRNYGRKRVYAKGKPYLSYLETHLCHHCNLNCKGCGHYCPLVTEEVFADVEQYENDIKELAKKIFIGKIRLMGGEPLLNQDICRFVLSTRKAFPKSNLCLVTNGILLPQMSEYFWQVLKENKVKVDLSKYPIVKNKFNDYVSLIKSKGVKIGMIHFADKFFKASNSKGNSDIKSTFINCESNVCANLYKSRIYTCPAIYRRFYNAFFYDNLEIPFSIDIYSANGKEIINGLRKPMSACRYCSSNMISFKWGKSNKLKEEWM